MIIQINFTQIILRQNEPDIKAYIFYGHFCKVQKQAKLTMVKTESSSPGVVVLEE